MWFGLDSKILDTTIFSEIFLFQELRLPAAKSWLQRFYFLPQAFFLRSLPFRRGTCASLFQCPISLNPS
jgi:hypothetical protein